MLKTLEKKLEKLDRLETILEEFDDHIKFTNSLLKRIDETDQLIEKYIQTSGSKFALKNETLDAEASKEGQVLEQVIVKYIYKTKS